MARPKTVALILGYQEPGWLQATLACTRAAGIQHAIIFREQGIGPMSPIFNQGMELLHDKCEFVWHLTNVTFSPDMPEKLLELFDDKTAAVHPSFESDHPHMRKSWDKPTVPFVEWTAPLVRCAAWEQIGPLDEQMGYWGMDLDWSYRAWQLGWKLKVATNCELGHTYLREVSNREHPITTRRREERAKHDQAVEARLIGLYGDDYLAKIWPSHPYNAQGRKFLHR